MVCSHSSFKYAVALRALCSLGFPFLSTPGTAQLPCPSFRSILLLLSLSLSQMPQSTFSDRHHILKQNFSMFASLMQCQNNFSCLSWTLWLNYCTLGLPIAIGGLESPPRSHDLDLKARFPSPFRPTHCILGPTHSRHSTSS